MKNEKEMNSALYELYNRNWPRLAAEFPTGTDKNFSHPFFIKVRKEYCTAKHRLLIVGKQTKAWAYNEPIDKDPVSYLMDFYDNPEHRKKWGKSVFLQAAYELNSLINPNSGRLGFIWSNLIKISQNRRKPDSQFENIICEYGFLQREVEILEPEIIVFFTGPNYDGRLKQTFHGAELEKLDGRKLYRIKHPVLPKNSFRTYHPRYLRLSGQWNILERIAKDFLSA